jgi:hypothetical protein
MEGAFLGPAFAQEDVERRLTKAGAHFTVVSDEDVIERTAASLAAGKAVGWMQGRMEFGPRALGARSILGDPRSPTMQKTLNLRVKYRESFRPFAPAVLREDVSDWFELDTDSPYVACCRRETGTAATHDQRGRSAFRHRQAQRGTLGHSRRHPRGLFGARADGPRRYEPTIPRADLSLQGQDGLPGAGQHQHHRAVHRSHERVWWRQTSIDPIKVVRRLCSLHLIHAIGSTQFGIKYEQSCPRPA